MQTKRQNSKTREKKTGINIFILIAMIFFMLGFIIYSNSLKCSFHFDDYRTIVNNQAIHRAANFSDIWNYTKPRFLTYFTFALNYQLGKESVYGYHIVNILFHIAASFVCFLLIYFTLRIPGIAGNLEDKTALLVAALGGIVFMVHPIQTGAVTYIVQRAESGATLFYLLTVLLYNRARQRCMETGNFFEKRHLSLYILSFASALLCYFSKETSATLPLMLLIYEWIFFAGTGWNARMLIGYLVPFFILPVLSACFFLNALAHPVPLSNPPAPLRTYLITEFVVLIKYITLLFLPINQNLDYDFPLHSSILSPVVLASMLFLLGLLITGFYLVKKDKIIAFCIFWFFVTLSVTSSVIPLSDVIFEHRLYLAMLSFAFFCSIIIYRVNNLVSPHFTDIKKKIKKKNMYFLWTAGIILALLFSILTILRNNVWKTELTMWLDVVKKSPNKSRAHENLGMSYYYSGNLNAALAELEKSLHNSPDSSSALNNMGLIYYQRKDYEEAEKYYKMSLRRKIGFDALQNLGVVYGETGRDDLAVLYYRMAIDYDPDYCPAAYMNLANNLMEHGKTAEALIVLKECVERIPDFPQVYSQAYHDIAKIYLKMGKKEEAARYLQR